MCGKLTLKSFYGAKIVQPVKVGSSSTRKGFDSLIVGYKTGIYGGVVQKSRTLVCHIRGHGFKSRRHRHKTWELRVYN